MKKIFAVLFSIVLLFGAFTPVFAETIPPIDVGNPLTGFTPREDNSTAMDFVQGRLGSLLNLMLRMLAVLSLIPIVFGGVMMITSNGSSDKVEKGKASIYWGVVGLTLAFMSILLYSLLLRILLPNNQSGFGAAYESSSSGSTGSSVPSGNGSSGGAGGSGGSGATPTNGGTGGGAGSNGSGTQNGSGTDSSWFGREADFFQRSGENAAQFGQNIKDAADEAVQDARTIN